ncbi:hypoxanthine phosphoribosyltransferase [Mycoplasmopsis adleri]|uniref:hypoxanthine phosphoribosyltransferase n=1 Tax=Mycoplasmopsis adleri TaxID=51362 RepID=UPI00387301F9
MNKIDPRIKEVIFTKEQLESRIKELAAWVNETYKDSKNLILVGLLKGSVPFLSQLIKDVTVDHKLDFMIASSYAGAHQSSGNVKIIMDLAEEIKDCDVLIVEDIIDSGITLSRIKNMLLLRKPKSFKILTLLDKPHHRKVDLFPDNYGFKAPDKFLIGFGLDYKEIYRNLPYIGVLDEKYIDKN